MKQTINIPEDCKAEVTREGDNIIVEIVPINKEFKVGDWVKCSNSYIFITEIQSEIILRGHQFRADNMLYIGECCTHVGNVQSRAKEYVEHRLKAERSLMINDQFEIVPWRANYRGEYEYLTWTQQVGKTINSTNADSTVYDSGNYFSEGFITEERLKEYKETVQKLFNKWRGLKQN